MVWTCDVSMDIYIYTWIDEWEQSCCTVRWRTKGPKECRRGAGETALVKIWGRKDLVKGHEGQLQVEVEYSKLWLL